MDQAKFVEVWKFEKQKFYLVHSWTSWPMCFCYDCENPVEIRMSDESLDNEADYRSEDEED